MPETAQAIAHAPAPESARKPRELCVARLTRDRFAEWDALVAKSPHGTVFHNSWWLEATGYELEILGCWDKNGRLVAGIPLPRKRRAGLMLYHYPPMAPYLGPIFDLSSEPESREQLGIMRYHGELLASAIQGFDNLAYPVGAAGPDLQGFLWAGFRAELSYTFRFEAGATPQQAMEGSARTCRQKFRGEKAKAIDVQSGGDVEALIELNRETFARQSKATPLTEAYLRRMWAVAAAHGCGCVYVARDAAGRPLSAVLVVHDSRTSYQIVSGMNADARLSPAGYLTTWAAIRDALSESRAFDFEGSRVRGVERYYRSWGGAAKPVWTLRKTGSLRGQIAVLWASGRNGRN